MEKPAFHKTFEPPRNGENSKKVNRDKLTEKMNKMENDINMLKEICQIQNASLSMILKEKTRHQRSKSIDYNTDNYYSQEKRRTLGKRF